jgi:hydrogenase nickel incorporation protein HypA/HybF
MHELSIALGIIDVAGEELDRQGGGRVEAIHLRLGPLSGVVKEALLSAWELACEQSPLAGSQLIIQEVPVTVFCPNCNTERPVVSIQEMRCAECGTLCPRVVQGRELEVAAMEIVDELENAQIG